LSEIKKATGIKTKAGGIFRLAHNIKELFMPALKI
jgi:hypothetical protein